MRVKKAGKNCILDLIKDLIDKYKLIGLWLVDKAILVGRLHRAVGNSAQVNGEENGGDADQQADDEGEPADGRGDGRHKVEHRADGGEDGVGAAHAEVLLPGAEEAEHANQRRENEDDQPKDEHSDLGIWLIS